MCGCYRPLSQDDQYFLNTVLDKYTQNYDRFLLIGDFNTEDFEPCLSEFLHDFNAENTVKEKTCFKSLANLVVLTYSLIMPHYAFEILVQ